MSNPIKWCDETWNPVIGCSPVSDGCCNCYAARMARRFCKKGEPFEGLIGREGWNGTVRFRPERLDKPFRWRKPRRIFVTSMGDLWHPSVTDEQIASVFKIMELTPRHIYLDLTKRPNMRIKWFERINKRNGNKFGKEIKWFVSTSILPNYWAGVSVENQRTANERIPFWRVHLRHTELRPAAKHFVSLEPCLGPVRFDEINFREDWLTDSLKVVDLVIVGAETGPGKRPMDLDWARSVRDQCAAAGVPFWFKKDSDGNETLDGVEHHPEFWR